MRESTLRDELVRIDTLSIIQVVAYFSHLNTLLRSHDCSDEERKNGLALLERLFDRVRILKSNLELAFP